MDWYSCRWRQVSKPKPRHWLCLPRIPTDQASLVVAAAPTDVLIGVVSLDLPAAMSETAAPFGPAPTLASHGDSKLCSILLQRLQGWGQQQHQQPETTTTMTRFVVGCARMCENAPSNSDQKDWVGYVQRIMRRLSCWLCEDWCTLPNCCLDWALTVASLAQSAQSSLRFVQLCLKLRNSFCCFVFIGTIFPSPPFTSPCLQGLLLSHIFLSMCFHSWMHFLVWFWGCSTCLCSTPLWVDGFATQTLPFFAKDCIVVLFSDGLLLEATKVSSLGCNWTVLS